MSYAPVLAWRQLARQKLRLLVALGGVAFAVILMLMQLGFEDAMFGSATRLHRLLKAELVLLHRDSHSLSVIRPFERQALYQALGHPAVLSVAALYLGNSAWKNPIDHTSRNLFLLGFDPSDEVIEIPELNAQRDALKIPERVLFDARSRPEFGPIAERFRAGKPVVTEIGDKRAEVAGLFEFGATFMADGNVVAGEDGFLRITGRNRQQIQIGLVRLRDASLAEPVKADLARRLPADVVVFTKPEFVEKEILFWQKNTAIGFIFGFGVAMGLIVGAVIVYQVLYADVADHMAEYATLKAMGYTNAFLSLVVLSEALILSLVGFLPGAAVSAGLYHLCEKATNLRMALAGGMALQVLLLTVLMCAASGALAVRKVQSADPADVF